MSRLQRLLVEAQTPKLPRIIVHPKAVEVDGKKFDLDSSEVDRLGPGVFKMAGGQDLLRLRKVKGTPHLYPGAFITLKQLIAGLNLGPLKKQLAALLPQLTALI